MMPNDEEMDTMPIWQNHEQRITTLEVTMSGLSQKMDNVEKTIKEGNEKQENKLDEINQRLFDEFFHKKRVNLFIGRKNISRRKLIMKKITAGTWARTIVLIVALINQALTMFGLNPIPFSEDEIYNGVTVLFTVVATLVAWWKDNDITKETIDKKERAGLR